jgi:hypothetical protein
MALLKNQRAESILRSFSDLSAADVATCPPDLIEKGRRLWQEVEELILVSESEPTTGHLSGQSGANLGAGEPPESNEPTTGHLNDQGGTNLGAVEPPEGNEPTIGHLSNQRGANLGAVEPPESNEPTTGHLSDQGGTNLGAEEPPESKESNSLRTALSEVKGKAESLMKKGIKDAVRSDLSEASHDPRVRDLTAAITTTPTNSQKFRHILVLPLWLEEYNSFKIRFPGRQGSIKSFSKNRGVTYTYCKEAIQRAKRLKYITNCYTEPGLSVLLAFTVDKWRRQSSKILEECARRCHEDATFPKFVQGLSEFLRGSKIEYTVLLNEGLAVIKCPISWTRFGWRTCPDKNGKERNPVPHDDQPTAAKTSDASRESREQERQTGMRPKCYLVLNANACLGTVALHHSVGDPAPARSNSCGNATQTEEAPVMEPHGQTTAHSPNDRSLTHSSSFNQVSSVTVFEGVNFLPLGGMGNSTPDDPDTVMREYNRSTSAQEFNQNAGLPWDGAGNPLPNLLPWAPQQENNGIDQNDGLPWEGTGNPQANLLLWAPQQENNGVDQNDGLPWDGTGPQDYVEWGPSRQDSSIVRFSQAYELGDVDMTVDSSQSLNPTHFVQQHSLQWWGNSQVAIA